MERIEKSVVIDAPVEKVFAYLNDPTNALEWSPGHVDVRNLTWEENKRHFEWTYKMAGLLLRGETTDTFELNRQIFSETKGGGVSTWLWTFEPHDGGTKLDLVVEYAIPIPVLGKVAEALVLRHNERDADLSLANIKDKMEA
jgi:uncharacterized protein YndB with AHSA1/START domain